MKRPTSFKVFGILNLFFSVNGVLGIASTLLLLNSPLTGDLMRQPMYRILLTNQEYLTFAKISLVVGAFFVIILFVSGIGLLRFTSWGRTLALVYSFYGIVSSMISGAIFYHYLFTPLWEEAASVSDPAEKSRLLGAAISGLVGTAFGMVYPIIMMLFLNRASVVEALENKDIPVLEAVEYEGVYSRY